MRTGERSGADDQAGETEEEGEEMASLRLDRTQNIDCENMLLPVYA